MSMLTFERVMLWLLVLVVIYQNINTLTEDKVADIATDVAADEIADRVDFDKYATIDDVNVVFKNVETRINAIEKTQLDTEAKMLELEGRVLEIELKGDE